MLKRFLQQHKMVVIADQAIFSATSFLLTLFLARHLSIADFGLYSGILLGLYLFVSLQSAFVIQPFQVNIAKAPSLQVYSSFIFWFQVTGMAAVALLSYGSRFIWAGNEVVSPGFWLFAFGFGLHDFFRKMLLARRMIQGAFYFDVIVAIGILAAIAVLFSSTNLRLTAIYRALGIAYLPAIIAGVLMIRPFDNITNCWVSWAKLHFQQGKWLFFTALVQWWAGNIWVVAAGIHLGAGALGALRLAQSLFGVLNAILQTFENYVLPQTAARLLVSSRDGSIFLRQITQKTAPVFVGLLFILFVCSDSIMELAGGNAFVPYGFVVKGMSLLYAIIFIGYPVRIAVRALVLNQHFFYGYLLSLGFGLLAGQFLLAHFDLYGAILGLIISQGILLVFWQNILQKNAFSIWK